MGSGVVFVHGGKSCRPLITELSRNPESAFHNSALRAGWMSHRLRMFMIFNNMCTNIKKGGSYGESVLAAQAR